MWLLRLLANSFHARSMAMCTGSPLILSNQTINGAKHNVLYIATENESVYAYDAETCGGGTPLWKVSLLKSGETALADEAILRTWSHLHAGDDPDFGTLYVVSTEGSSSAGAHSGLVHQRHHGRARKFGGPVTINASVAATNSDSVKAWQTLDTSCLQRAALLLANGNVYIGLGGCHSGWAAGIQGSTLHRSVFNASPKLNG